MSKRIGRPPGPPEYVVEITSILRAPRVKSLEATEDLARHLQAAVLRAVALLDHDGVQVRLTRQRPRRVTVVGATA